jgi:hypothetical protein
LDGFGKVDLMDKRMVPVMPVDLQDGLEGFPFAGGPGFPSVELACAFRLPKVDFVADQGDPVFGTLVQGRNEMNLPKEGIELEPNPQDEETVSFFGTKLVGQSLNLEVLLKEFPGHRFRLHPGIESLFHETPPMNL